MQCTLISCAKRDSGGGGGGGGEGLKGCWGQVLFYLLWWRSYDAFRCGCPRLNVAAHFVAHTSDWTLFYASILTSYIYFIAVMNTWMIYFITLNVAVTNFYDTFRLYFSFFFFFFLLLSKKPFPSMFFFFLKKSFHLIFFFFLKKYFRLIFLFITIVGKFHSEILFPSKTFTYF